MHDSICAAGSIAAYLADLRAIKARWADYCERSRLADLEADKADAEPASPRDYSRRQYRADLEACEGRHFGTPSPRTGHALTTPARLWRWIDYAVNEIERWAVSLSRDPAPSAKMNPRAFWDALQAAYRQMHVLDLPGTPTPPYPPMSEGEARDALRSIANDLRRREAEPDRASPQSNGDSARISPLGENNLTDQPDNPIPPERRTREMTKSEAAAAMWGSKKGRGPQQKLSRRIKAGKIQAHPTNRQTFIFDVHDFPVAVRPKIQPI